MWGRLIAKADSLADSLAISLPSAYSQYCHSPVTNT
jgi:hypothetical protein